MRTHVHIYIFASSAYTDTYILEGCHDGMQFRTFVARLVHLKATRVVRIQMLKDGTEVSWTKATVLRVQGLEFRVLLLAYGPP